MSRPIVKVENGIQRVLPYYFDYKTTFKLRWRGMLVSQVLTLELGQQPEVVQLAIENGDIYVTRGTNKAENEHSVVKFDDLSTTTLTDHDIIHNRQHMHEPPVPFGRIDVIYSDDDIVVVNKPGGIPTHPTGTYRYNSITEMLKEHVKLELYPCHRLDKGTLGILVLARNREQAALHQKLFQSLSTRKTYLARVTQKDWSQAQEPLRNFQHQEPVFLINTAGAGHLSVRNAHDVPNSTTVISEIARVPKSKDLIFECRPLTGRTHQIRIHLRNLGFPIANDPIYLENSTKNQLERAMYQRLKENAEAHRNGYFDISGVIDWVAIRELAGERSSRELSRVLESCPECGRHLYEKDPENAIWLHAYKLEIGGKVFQTELPDWAEIGDVVRAGRNEATCIDEQD